MRWDMGIISKGIDIFLRLDRHLSAVVRNRISGGLV